MNIRVADYIDFIRYIEEMEGVAFINFCGTPADKLVRSYLRSQQRRDFEEALDEYDQSKEMMGRISEFLESYGAMVEQIHSYFLDRVEGKKFTVPHSLATIVAQLNTLQKNGGSGEVVCSLLNRPIKIMQTNDIAVQKALPLDSTEVVEEKPMPIPKFIEAIRLQRIAEDATVSTRVSVGKVIKALKYLNEVKHIMNVEDVKEEEFLRVKTIGGGAWRYFKKFLKSLNN